MSHIISLFVFYSLYIYTIRDNENEVEKAE